MAHLPELTTHWIANYGNFGIFILLALGILGLPIPDETLIAFSGALVAQNKLPFFITQITVFAGAVIGITISYLIGRFIGKVILINYGRHFGLTENRLQQGHAWFERIGKWILLIGYFIPGIRHLTGIIAGSTRLNYLHFAIFAYSGALIWSQLFFALGYYFSRDWKLIVHQIIYYSWIGGILLFVVLIILGSWLFFKYYNNKHSRNVNRS